MARRIVVCADGTWNEPDQTDRDRSAPSNVVKIARAVRPVAADGSSQTVFYGSGVGTGAGLWDHVTGGAFGKGISKHIVDAYRFLVDNHAEGDELFFFGFSRGAYTVRSLAGLIRNGGLVRKEHADRIQQAYALYRKRDEGPDTDEAGRFRDAFSKVVRVKFIGVWDTVGALGVPVRPLRFWTKSRYEFHDVKLSRSIDHAYHALAVDERRKAFAPTLWEQQEGSGSQAMEQRWFAGAHCNVGGGYEDSDLSDIAFRWMADKARSCGLDLGGREATTPENPLGRLRNSATGLFRLLGTIERPVGERGPRANEELHPSVTDRWLRDGTYRPANLRDAMTRQRGGPA